MNDRRTFFGRFSSLTAALFAGNSIASAQQSTAGQGGMGQMDMRNMQPATGTAPVTPGASPGATSTSPVRVTTLDVADLPFTEDNGVKVFNLVAEPVKQ